MADNHQVIIASLPTGALAASDFEVRGAPMPEPADGQVLCRTIALTIGAGQRAGLQGSASYAGAPEAGRLMGGNGVAEVVESRAGASPSARWSPRRPGGRSTRCTRPRPCRCSRPDIDPATALGALGTNGLTAYFGLLDVGRPQPGETVRRVRCGRLGRPHRRPDRQARRLPRRRRRRRRRQVPDARRRAGLRRGGQLPRPRVPRRVQGRHARPDRRVLRQHRRTGAGERPVPHGDARADRVLRRGQPVRHVDTRPGPRGVPGLLVNNRVRMEGLLVFDYADRYDQARADMAAWIAEGSLHAEGHRVPRPGPRPRKPSSSSSPAAPSARRWSRCSPWGTTALLGVTVRLALRRAVSGTGRGTGRAGRGPASPCRRAPTA